MLKFLAVLGWIILAILILVIWFILVPRTIYIEYTQEKSIVVKIRLFLFKIKVYPISFSFGKIEKTKKVKVKSKTEQTQTKNKTQEQTYTQVKTQSKNQKQSEVYTQKKTQPHTSTQTKIESKTKKSESKPKNKFKETVEYILNNKSIIKDVFATVKGALKILFNGIKIKDVSFIVPVCADDAHDVQKKYAAFTTAFYSLNIFLQKYIKIYYKSPIFIADFANIYEDKDYFYCKIQASPSIIIILGWYLFKQYNQIMSTNKSLKEK